MRRPVVSSHFYGASVEKAGAETAAAAEAAPKRAPVLRNWRRDWLVMLILLFMSDGRGTDLRVRRRLPPSCGWSAVRTR